MATETPIEPHEARGGPESVTVAGRQLFGVRGFEIASGQLSLDCGFAQPGKLFNGITVIELDARSRDPKAPATKMFVMLDVRDWRTTIAQNWAGFDGRTDPATLFGYGADIRSGWIEIEERPSRTEVPQRRVLAEL